MNLILPIQHPVRAQNAGLFISRGNAMHPTRIIDTHELIFVKHGVLDMWEEDQHFHLQAGDTLHLYPGRQHGSTKPMPSDLRFYWIHFDINTLAAESEPHYPDMYRHLRRIPQHKRVQRPEKLEHLFRLFMEDQESGSLQPFSANLLTTMMLAEVSLSAEDRPAHSEEASVIATAAHTYIRINFDSPLSAGKIAAAMGYNPDYLGRIYRRVYGCTLTDAIHRCRVQVACQMLLDTSLAVEQIASQCGFQDADYFRRIFRRQIQMSPGEYRNAYTRVHVNTH